MLCEEGVERIDHRRLVEPLHEPLIGRRAAALMLQHVGALVAEEELVPLRQEVHSPSAGGRWEGIDVAEPDPAVDLFADDPLVFKKLIYEMRFDEASAKFAEFGPFYIGLQFGPDQLGTLLSGRVPSL